MLTVSALQAGTVTTKNSCSRNLHRLLSSVSFISELLRNLSADSACTLHTAAASAYNGTMSPIHNFFVRTAVKTSMYTLPTRAGFLESIGETGKALAQTLLLSLFFILNSHWLSAHGHWPSIFCHGFDDWLCVDFVFVVQRKVLGSTQPSSFLRQHWWSERLRPCLQGHLCPSQTQHGQAEDVLC